MTPIQFGSPEPEDSEEPRDPEISSARDAPRPNFVGIGLLLVLIFVGIGYSVTAFSYGFSAENSPIGPGAVPGFLGILLVIGSLVILAQEIRAFRQAQSQAKARGKEEDVDTTGRTPPARAVVKRLLIVLVLAGGCMLSPVVGMTLSIPLAAVVIARAIEKIRPFCALIMGAVTVLMLWGIFQQCLNVRFPSS